MPATRTIHRRVIALCAAFALCATFALCAAFALAQAAHASEFSAEIVSRDASGSPLGAPAKIYVSNRMVRIETPEAADGFFLIDADTGTALFILPRQRAVMAARQSSRLTQVFVAIDADDPCRQWRAAAIDARGTGASADWHCERTEERAADGRAADGRSVDGHSIVGYRVAAADADAAAGLRWVDTGLGFPVKVSAADGTSASLEHVRVAAQPAELFTVPAGFRRFDPQALIERIKHSDVWVDP